MYRRPGKNASVHLVDEIIDVHLSPINRELQESQYLHDDPLVIPNLAPAPKAAARQIIKLVGAIKQHVEALQAEGFSVHGVFTDEGKVFVQRTKAERENHRLARRTKLQQMQKVFHTLRNETLIAIHGLTPAESRPALLKLQQDVAKIVLGMES